MDLSTYSLDQLKSLKRDVEKGIASFKIRALENARTELEKHAETLGYSLEEIMNSKTKRTKIAPKYRDPNHSDNTWTGRGRKPIWVLNHLDAGKTLKDLEI